MVPVGVIERVGDLAGNAQGVGNRELVLPPEPLAQRLALDERHDVIQEAVGDAGVEEREDMRVLEVGGGPDLRQEPFGTEDRGQLGSEHLDGDLAVVLAVVGEIYGGHPALPELALDLVAVGQGGLQATEETGHSGHGRVEDESILLAARTAASSASRSQCCGWALLSRQQSGSRDAHSPGPGRDLAGGMNDRTIFRGRTSAIGALSAGGAPMMTLG
jgi:hypothetical protein